MCKFHNDFLRKNFLPELTIVGTLGGSISESNVRIVGAIWSLFIIWLIWSDWALIWSDWALIWSDWALIWIEWLSRVILIWLSWSRIWFRIGLIWSRIGFIGSCVGFWVGSWVGSWMLLLTPWMRMSELVCLFRYLDFLIGLDWNYLK